MLKKGIFEKWYILSIKGKGKFNEKNKKYYCSVFISIRTFFY